MPDDDYRAFLKGIGVRLPAGGPMVLLDGHVVGRHGGLWRYTEGGSAVNSWRIVDGAAVRHRKGSFRNAA